MQSVSKSHMIFFAANAAWLVFFSLFALWTSVGASVLFAVSFITLFVLCIFLFAKFAAEIENKSALEQWLYVAAIILIGLVLRIFAWQIFRTDQLQDFARAHDAYMYLARYGSLAPEMNFFQLYYSRFPGWFPHFLVTRTVYDIFGANVRNMIFVNYALYAASAAVLFATVRRIFSFRVAFCAAAFFIFNPNLVVWANITSPDPFFVLLFMCVLCFYSKDLREARTSHNALAIAAVFAALTDFFKPIGIMILIAFFCVEILKLLACESGLRILLKPGAILGYLADNYKRWLVFSVTFLAVYFAGHALVRAEIQRVFHTETVSSTGMYMAFAWSTDDYGNYDISPVFEAFNDLMYLHDNDQTYVMEGMWDFAREAFAEADVPRVLWQKARLTFGDEGVLGWVIHSTDEEHSAATHRVLGRLLWIGFTAHIFVIMFLAALGTLKVLGDPAFEPSRAHSASAGRRTADAPGFAEGRPSQSGNAPTFVTFLLTTVIGYTLILLLGVAQARYRILLYPQLSILAAVGVVWLARTDLELLRFHGRKVVLPVDAIKKEIADALANVTQIVDFGAGTLFWSEYFAAQGTEVFAADTSYAAAPPATENPQISLYTDVREAIAKASETAPTNKPAIFICDVIHHLPPDFWLEILAQITEKFDVIIIKDIDARDKFGNFMNKFHDRVVSGEKITNVHPQKIEKALADAGFSVQTKKMRKLWYPHFLIIAKRTLLDSPNFELLLKMSLSGCSLLF
ncbi:MAG: class I SAM-dependent methyltransferase [Defluviitaleaceae bacterium]|nr:class I SAM-dependent methyltransferase [Defluviitaleaceae bacterium]